MNALARAAIAGDEKALDMFQWKKGGIGNGAVMKGASNGNNESLSFFLGCQGGSIFMLNEACKLQPLFNVEGDVKKLLYHTDRNLLIVLTDKLFLVQYEIKANGSFDELSNVS